jgi:hypothetical protein
MTEVRPLFVDKQPIEAENVTPSLVDMAAAVAAIAATRLLLLITVLTGAATWLWTVYDPQPWRLYAACAFSVVFVGPQILLYFRKG